MAKKKEKENKEAKEIYIVNPDEVKAEVKEEVKSLDEMSIDELKQHYIKQTEEYKKRVSELNSVEELEALEKELMTEYDEHDKIISERSYPLAEDIVFNGRRLTRDRIGQIISNFIDKMEVEYRATLGLWQLWRWWKTPEKSIGYGAYDSTVRILGTLKYKGSSEWENLMAVIEYLKPSNDIYTRDLLRGDFIAQRHNEIMNRMDLISGHTAAADALEGLPYNPTEANMPKELVEKN